MKKSFKHEIVDSMREIIFGLEDSLVSTLGAITGIAVGAQSTYIVIMSGLVLIAAESTSMAAGSYLSSKSASEAEAEFHKENGEKVALEPVRPKRAAVVMGVFYFIGGFVPLSFYFFLPVNTAIIPSIITTAVVLFLVGVWAASFTKNSRVKSGLEMVLISLTAALVGYAIGYFMSYYFGIEVNV